MTESEQAVDVELLSSEEDQQAPAVADDVLPETLHIMPIPGRPFFPGQVQPVAINPGAWASTLQAVAEGYLQTDGNFEATPVQAKCASQYEAEYGEP